MNPKILKTWQLGKVDKLSSVGRVLADHAPGPSSGNWLHGWRLINCMYDANLAKNPGRDAPSVLNQIVSH